MAFGVVLGAPKIITVPDEIRRTLGSVRMDTCAFVGVSPKGPVRRPQMSDRNCQSLQDIVDNWLQRDRSVAIEIDSWDQYQSLFGGFEGPGRLPYAVANFFEQGGQRAYICRIVHQYDNVEEDLLSVATATISNVYAGPEQITLRAKNEGQWGNNLQAALGFNFQPIEFLSGSSSTASLCLADRQNLVAGDLLRIINNDPVVEAINYSEYRFVEQVNRRGDNLAEISAWEIVLAGSALPNLPTAVQQVSAQCVVSDVSTGFEESFANLRFSPLHERYLGLILLNQSTLVDPAQEWLLTELLPPSIDFNVNDFEPYQARNVLQLDPSKFSGGEDRYQDIVHDDFFDSQWVMGDERPGDGIHSLSLLKDCSMLVIPDLYVPETFEPTDANENPELLSTAEFAPCVELSSPALDVETPRPSLPGLLLDPMSVADRQYIIQLQQRALKLAAQLKEFILLLDVPPALNQRQVTQWRIQFNSSFCAAYHPWLKINDTQSDSDIHAPPVLLNPSAVAAGIIAATELRSGIAQGPANQIAQSVFALDLNVTSEQHDQLHPMGINVFKQQRDGVCLTAARTLSQQSQWRQLSVVRLMVMLRRALLIQMQWLVFEPNTPALWLDVQFTVQNFLRQLYIAGTFKGETEQQAYFVRCDAALNTRQVVDAGMLIAEIGVAPVEPMEFILLKINRGADGTLKIVSN